MDIFKILRGWPVGAGISRMCCIATALRRTALRILEEYSATDDAFHIYYPHRSHMPGKLRAFVDFMRDANRSAIE